MIDFNRTALLAAQVIAVAVVAAMMLPFALLVQRGLQAAAQPPANVTVYRHTPHGTQVCIELRREFIFGAPQCQRWAWVPPTGR